MQAPVFESADQIVPMTLTSEPGDDVPTFHMSIIGAIGPGMNSSFNKPESVLRGVNEEEAHLIGGS